MDTVTEKSANEKTSDENERILQIDRSLLPLEKYAQKKGLPESIIRKCSELGLIQLRKFKGRTFVVDTPLSPYITASDESDDQSRSADAMESVEAMAELAKDTSAQIKGQYYQKGVKKHNERFSRFYGWFKNLFERLGKAKKKLKETLKNNSSEDITAGFEKETVEGENEQTQFVSDNELEKLNFPSFTNVEENWEQTLSENQAVEPEQTSEQIEENEPEISDEYNPVTNYPEEQNQQHEQNLPEEQDFFRELNLEPPNPPTVTKELTQSELDELSKMETHSEPIRIPDLEKDDSFEETVDISDETTPNHSSYPSQTIISKNNTLWKLTLAGAIILLITALVAGIWFYKDSQIQQNKLDQAYASVQSVYADFIHQKKQAETARTQLENTGEKLRELQNELEKSNAAVLLLKENLQQAKQDLKRIQNQNSAEVANLNQQIKRLIERINKNSGQELPG